MTNHATNAAERIQQQQCLSSTTILDEAYMIPVIQTAIDAATAELRAEVEELRKRVRMYENSGRV